MKQTFSVAGMDCEHCVARVDKAVRELSGVQDVLVSLEEESMVVDFNGEAISPQSIIDAVVEAGYEAQALL